MDKIKYVKVERYLIEGGELTLLERINELIEEYNEIKANLKRMSYYNELDRRLKRLETIEVKRMLENK